MVHKEDWVGTTLMDPAEPVFEDLLLEQLDRHITRLDHFEGIAIDRLDYTQYFNLEKTDEHSWVPTNASAGSPGLDVWGPARALRLSHRHTFARIRAALKDRFVMLQNCNLLCRLDLMESADASFSEGAALNGVAWTGLRSLSILWTYRLDSDAQSLDSYFQQHLLMNVYPMAPMVKNVRHGGCAAGLPPGLTPIRGRGAGPQHRSRRPCRRGCMCALVSPPVPPARQPRRRPATPDVDYAPLFEAMRGARWQLTAHVAAVTAGTVNALYLERSGRLPDLRVPIMLAGANETCTLTLNLGAAGWHTVPSAVTLVALHPGGGSVQVGSAQAKGGGTFAATIPLVRGSSMVLAALQ